MASVILTAAINLLSTISQEHGQEFALINELNSFFNFDHNVFLLDSSVDQNERNQFMSETSSLDTIPRTIYVHENENDTIVGVDSLRKIESKNIFLIVFLKCINVDRNLNVLAYVKRLQELNRDMKIGIFSSEPSTSNDDMTTLFKWFWSQYIINIFEVHRDTILSIFTYNPFQTFDVINLTGSKAYDKFFLSQKTNFHQHTIRLRMTDKIWPAEVSVWFEGVFPVINASYCTDVVLDYDLGPLELYDNSTVDVEPTIYYLSYMPIIKLYPMSMDPLIIVVPEASPYPEFVIYLRTVSSSAFIGYALVIVVAVIFLLSYFRYIHRKRCFIFQSMIDVVNILANDNASIKYQELSRVEALLIVPLTFAGFMIVNGTVSILQSYMTKAFIQPQVSTIDEVYRSTFPILTDFDFIGNTSVDVLNTISNVGNFSSRIKSMEPWEYDREVQMFNTSVSFIMTLPYAQNLVRLQKQLGIRGFHITDIYLYREIGSFNVKDAYPFISRFDEIIGWLRNGGLYAKWEQDDLLLLERIIRKNLKENQADHQTDNAEIPMPTLVLYGWCCSICVFIVEIVWKKWNLQRGLCLALNSVKDKPITTKLQRFR